MLAYPCDMHPLLPEPANDDFRPKPGDVVATYFAKRGMRRALTAAASCLAALVLMLTLVHGFQTSGPLPELATSSSSF